MSPVSAAWHVAWLRRRLDPWLCDPAGGNLWNCTKYDAVKATAENQCPTGAQWKLKSDVPVVTGCLVIPCCMTSSFDHPLDPPALHPQLGVAGLSPAASHRLVVSYSLARAPRSPGEPSLRGVGVWYETCVESLRVVRLWRHPARCAAVAPLLSDHSQPVVSAGAQTSTRAR